MKLEGFSEVVYFVHDVQEAMNWYEKLTGLRPSFDSTEFVSFDLGATRLSLHPADEKCLPGVSGQVVYWSVSNLENSIKELIEEGCELYRGPVIGIDGARVCQVLDPFGNAIGLLEGHSTPEKK